MKRPAVYIGFSYILGLLIASVTTDWHSMQICSVILMAALLITAYRKTVWKYVLLSTLSCLMACCNYWYTENRMLSQVSYAGQETVFTGQIVESRMYQEQYATYILTGEFADTGTCAKVEMFCDVPNLHYGDILTISGSPERIVSDYVFDDAAYYKAKQVYLCYDMCAEILDIQEPEKATLRIMLHDWRERMTERILSYMSEDAGAMLTGMLFGDKSNLRYGTKTALYRTGIGHVLAVSGLHLDFLAVCAMCILNRCKAGRKLSFIIIAGLCGLFVLCVGETISVKRACIMLLLSQSANIFFRRADSLNSLAIAMGFLGIENPFVVYSPAFWLSCSGAFGIGVLAESMTRDMKTEHPHERIFKKLVSFCWVWVAVLPVCVVYYREVSLLSPVSNMILVPICMISMGFGAIAVCFGCQGTIAEYCLSVAEILNQIVLDISKYLGGLSWTHAATESEVLLYIMMTGILLCMAVQILDKSKKHTSLCVCLVLAASCISVSIENMYQEEDLKIAILGNEKDCLLAVCKNQEALLIDISGNTAAAKYAITYLEQTGTETTEALYLCNPKEKSLLNYQKYLSFLMPESVYFMKETEDTLKNFWNDEIYSTDSAELLFHNAYICVTRNQVSIEYAGIYYICTNEETEISESPDILTVYGTSTSVQPDSGILIILDKNTCYRADVHTYTGENNLEMTITKSGTCRVRRLYGDS